MRTLLGIDVGYGFTKVYGKGVRFKFPSLLSANVGDVLDTTNIIRFNGSEFVVGVGSKDIRSDEFPFTPEYKALLYFAIVQVLKKYPAQEVYVGIGVPPVFKSMRDELKRELSRKVSVDVGGVKYSFLLKTVVFLQGWGGYIDHIYNLEGRYLKDNDRPAIYSDWGFYTIDTIITKRVWSGEGERIVPSLPESSPTIKKGVSTLYQIYRKLVADKYGIAIPDLRTAEGMFLSGKYPEEARKATRVWKQEVLEEILARYKEEVFGLEKIVVFGGGANFIEEDFRAGELPVIKLDEFANARGYFKALPSALKRGE